MSAKELQRELGIGYHAAWLLLQKLRLAMVRPGRDQDKLSGDIEVDESYLGGPTPGGKRGRGAEGKVIIAIAVERKGFGKKSKRWKLGRTRIQVVPDVKAKTLLDFVEDTCEQGSTIYTDGLAAYKNLPSRGFKHDANAVSQGNDPAHVVLPAVHRVASLVKRWLLGTHHGGIGAQNAVVVKKLTTDTLVWSRRGQAGKRRGPHAFDWRRLKRKMNSSRYASTRCAACSSTGCSKPKPKTKRAPKGCAALKTKTVGQP